MVVGWTELVFNSAFPLALLPSTFIVLLVVVMVVVVCCCCCCCCSVGMPPWWWGWWHWVRVLLLVAAFPALAPPACFTFARRLPSTFMMLLILMLVCEHNALWLLHLVQLCQEVMRRVRVVVFRTVCELLLTRVTMLLHLRWLSIIIILRSSRRWRRHADDWCCWAGVVVVVVVLVLVVGCSKWGCATRCKALVPRRSSWPVHGREGSVQGPFTSAAVVLLLAAVATGVAVPAAVIVIVIVIVVVGVSTLW